MFIGTIGNCLTVASGTCTGTGMLKTIGGMFFGMSGTVFIILSAVIGIAVAYLLFKFAWRKIKGTVR